MSGAYTLNDYVTDLRQITREAESECRTIGATFGARQDMASAEALRS
jgi:hypothetical protein